MDEWQRYVVQEIIDAEDRLRVLDILSSLESMESSQLIPIDISYNLFNEIQNKYEETNTKINKDKDEDDEDVIE